MARKESNKQGKAAGKPGKSGVRTKQRGGKGKAQRRDTAPGDFVSKRVSDLPKDLKRRVKATRQWVQENHDEIERAALVRKAEIDELDSAFELLRKHREEQDVSLSELARKSGIDRARLSRLESNANPNVTMKTLNRIAAALGLKVVIAVVPASE